VRFYQQEYSFDLTFLSTVSFLDLPDLAVLAQVVPALMHLTTDPVLHTYRLRIVSPSRVNHKLFGVSPQGHALRPTLVDLVHRGVIKGLGIERRWRMGGYFYSLNVRSFCIPFVSIQILIIFLSFFFFSLQKSIVQYENMCSLSRRHASHVLAVQLRRRTINGTASHSLQTLCSSHVFPDVESSSLNVARSLLPIMRKLKWCLQRDRLAKVFKVSGVSVGIGAWLDKGDSQGRKVVQEGEKVRLALCPGIRTKIGFYERLGKI